MAKQFKVKEILSIIADKGWSHGRHCRNERKREFHLTTTAAKEATEAATTATATAAAAAQQYTQE